jgi:hypothetical protein
MTMETPETTNQQPAGIPVTERVFVRRLNRRLRADGEMVRRGRTLGGEPCWDLIDCRINGMLIDNVDVEALAREQGCLQSYERLAEDA